MSMMRHSLLLRQRLDALAPTAHRLNRHYKAALCVLELDELIEVMQLLVVLEDCVLVKNVKKKEEYLLQFDMQRAGFNDGENLIDI